jgi:hypothetical protein
MTVLWILAMTLAGIGSNVQWLQLSSCPIVRLKSNFRLERSRWVGG